MEMADRNCFIYILSSSDEIRNIQEWNLYKRSRKGLRFSKKGPEAM